MGWVVGISYTLILSGILGIMIDLIAIKSINEKLEAKDFGLKVTLPTMLCLLLMGIGFMMLFSDVAYKGAEYEFPFQVVIIVSSIFGIAMAYLSAMLSMIRLRWVAD